MMNDAEIVQQQNGPFQRADGGATPTSPLQIKNCIVRRIEFSIARPFVEKWHYAHSVKGISPDYCFGLFSCKDRLLGVAMYRTPPHWVAGAYSKNPKKVTELRRLCCIDDTPKNIESFFISKTLIWLKKNTDLELVLSYADTTQGHIGIIYKASNFMFRGISKPERKILYKGLQYSRRVITPKCGGSEPESFIRRMNEIKSALTSGEAKWVETKPKNIYTFSLNR